METRILQGQVPEGQQEDEIVRNATFGVLATGSRHTLFTLSAFDREISTFSNLESYLLVAPTQFHRFFSPGNTIWRPKTASITHY